MVIWEVKGRPGEGAGHGPDAALALRALACCWRIEGHVWELGVICPHPKKKKSILTPLCLAFPAENEAVLWVGFGNPQV